MRPEVKAGQKWKWLGKFDASMLTPGEAYDVLRVNGANIFIDDDNQRQGVPTPHSWSLDPEEDHRSFYECFELVEPGVAPAPDIGAHIADTAKSIVSGARRGAYGSPERNFERIARYWTAYFQNTGRGVTVTASDVSPMMRFVKEARLNENPKHLDSFVDLVGYTLTGAETNGVDIPD